MSRHQIRTSVFLMTFLMIFLTASGALRAAPIPPAGCEGAATRACLGDGRFRVEVGWFGESPAADAADARPLGRDAAYFRSPGGAGLVVQVLDGRAINGHFWVLSGALSHPSYSLAVTDLQTGESRTYSELEQDSSDLRAFPSAGTGEARPYAAGPQSLRLESGRLQVEMEGDRLHATALADHSGYFWTDDPARPELVVSVVDGRQVTGSDWILYGSPSGAPGTLGTLRMTDTLAHRLFEGKIAAGDTTTHVLTQALPGPRSVTLTLDRTRSVKATVPVAGQTLTASSANGTVFTLIIPPGALLSEETITLTPVVSLGGLPFHPGLVAAVHLEPEGLRLFQPATLRIKPPVAVPRAQEMTFAYRGTGQEFFLFPPSVNAAGVELKLLHFSGYGVAKGALAEQTAQLLRLPTRAEDRLSQKLQSIVSKKRRGGRAQAAAVLRDYVSDLEQVLRDTYKTSIKPNLGTVTTNCALLKKQIPIMLGWSRQVQLLGLDQIAGFAPEVAAIFDALEKGTANCYNEAFGKCVNQHDPLQVTNMLSSLRQLELLGGENLVDQSRIERCVRFDLDFETDVESHSTVQNPYGLLAGFRMKLRAKVPLRFDGLHVSGSAPLEWLSATWTGVLPSGVTVNTVAPGQGSTLAVTDLGFDLNVYEGAPPPPHVKLTYDPGSPVVTNIFTFATDPPVTIPFPDYPWRVPYYFLHQDELLAGNDGPLVARDWSVVGGSVWARKTYQRSRNVPEVTASETTLMDLIHTPEP